MVAALEDGLESDLITGKNFRCKFYSQDHRIFVARLQQEN